MSAQTKTDNKLYFASFANLFEMKVHETNFPCAYDNVNMAQVKSYYKGDTRNNDKLRAIKFPDVTQCNAIIVTSTNYIDYPFIHTMHAPPGCFGTEIDGNEQATLSGDINKFVVEVEKHFPILFQNNQNCKDKKIEIDIYLIGTNINYSRGTYLKSIFSKLHNIEKINIKVKDVSDKFIISNFDYSEISISPGNWDVMSNSTHKYLDIYFFMSDIIEFKIDGWNSQGPYTEFSFKND
ncbi:hypothetical protein CPAV1605_474 [seawater metagenome]|uniref:Uncharacterized protein n=1 Tax=seawater metagenome TaxID=1561972 RepID=A0A5E8CJF1_9ZZZZ